MTFKFTLEKNLQGPLFMRNSMRNIFCFKYFPETLTVPEIKVILKKTAPHSGGFISTQNHLKI